MVTRIEIDESAYIVLAMGAAWGYYYHVASAEVRVLLEDIAAGAFVFLILAMIATFVAMMTEMLIWDWLWQRVRGGSE